MCCVYWESVVVGTNNAAINSSYILLSLIYSNYGLAYNPTRFLLLLVMIFSRYKAQYRSKTQSKNQSVVLFIVQSRVRSPGFAPTHVLATFVCQYNTASLHTVRRLYNWDHVHYCDFHMYLSSLEQTIELHIHCVTSFHILAPTECVLFTAWRLSTSEDVTHLVLACRFVRLTIYIHIQYIHTYG